jgi:hypothetical protein
MDDVDLPSDDPEWRDRFDLEPRPVWVADAGVVVVPKPTPPPVQGPVDMRIRQSFTTSSVMISMAPPPIEYTEPSIPPGHAAIVHRKAIR